MVRNAICRRSAHRQFAITNYANIFDVNTPHPLPSPPLSFLFCLPRGREEGQFQKLLVHKALVSRTQAGFWFIFLASVTRLKFFSDSGTLGQDSRFWEEFGKASGLASTKQLTCCVKFDEIPIRLCFPVSGINRCSIPFSN